MQNIYFYVFILFLCLVKGSKYVMHPCYFFRKNYNSLVYVIKSQVRRKINIHDLTGLGKNNVFSFTKSHFILNIFKGIL